LLFANLREQTIRQEAEKSTSQNRRSMENRKLWKIFKSLSDRERRRFSHWLEGELEDKQYYLQQLNQILVEAFPDAPDRQQIWKMLYPKSSFDDARLRKLTRDLTGWLEEFLAVEAFRKDEAKKDLFLLRNLSERGLNEEFGKLVRKLDRQLQGQEVRDRSFFRFKYELELICQEYETQNRSKIRRPTLSTSPDGKADHQSLKRIQQFFDQWWVQEKLFIGTALLSQKQATGLEVDSLFLEELIEFLKTDNLFSQEPISQLYNQVYLLLSGEEVESIKELLGILTKEIHKLPEEDLHTLWLQMVNFYVRSWNNTGDNRFGHPLALLFEWAIEADILLVDGYLPETYYKNLIIICLRIQEYEKAWTYLHQYKSKLKPGIAEKVYVLSLSGYYNYQDQFQEVIDLLRPVKFVKPLDEIRARSYLLNAYFAVDMEDEEWLLSQTNNLIRYIRSKSYLPNEHKKPLLNRFQLFKKILKTNQKDGLNQLLEQIDSTHPLDDPSWLRDKVERKLLRL
jgi:hypothetical protein